MQRKQRLPLIVSTIVDESSADVPSLARRFAVSEATIRRDLAALEDQQLINRTHGGATTHVAFHDVPLGIKTSIEMDAKRRIAMAALPFADGVRVIGMTGGTTAYELARLLTGRSRSTVVTNALNIAATMVGVPGLRVFAAGGEVRASSQEVVGPAAEAFLGEYHLDVSFIGIDAVDPVAGLTNYDPMGARVNAVMCARSTRTVVLADSTKLGRTALARVADLRDIDVLVTDARADPAVVAAIESRGCRVLTA